MALEEAIRELKRCNKILEPLAEDSILYEHLQMLVEKVKEGKSFAFC